MERGVILCTELGADKVGGLMHKRFVEGGGHTDSLGEDSGYIGTGNAVKTFVPPVVFRNVETWNRGGGMAELRSLFFESHARDEIVDALFDGHFGIEVRSFG